MFLDRKPHNVAFPLVSHRLWTGICLCISVPCSLPVEQTDRVDGARGFNKHANFPNCWLLAIANLKYTHFSKSTQADDEQWPIDSSRRARALTRSGAIKRVYMARSGLA